MTEPLDQKTTEALIRRLRYGATCEEAAAAEGVTPPQVYVTARGSADLVLALAGHDPYSTGQAEQVRRADYLRLLTLGCSASLAARILFHGDTRVTGWRTDWPGFALACDAVQTRRKRGGGRNRFTPHRRALFLSELRGGALVYEAAQAAGVNTATIYQLRHRDPEFVKEIARARAEAPRAGRRTRVSPEQWETFRQVLADRRSVTLARAAEESGIPPVAVYERRARDEEFRRETERLRGVYPRPASRVA